LEHAENCDAKERILSAASQLFSQKGFDAASVSEIAKTANVTKALIYYYFKSKEEILDQLVQAFMDNATSLVLDFIHANIVQMIKDGSLDIEPDRLRFTDEREIRRFLENVKLFYERLMDYALQQRAIIRILMLESLKSSKHQGDLFRLLELTTGDEENPIFRTISEADQDFNYSEDMVVYEFFFSIIPLVNFAAYYDDYKEISSLSDGELRGAFLRSFQTSLESMVCDNSILLRN
jgi:AcrR family transcriptional regulator